jgi:8-oxo-dGTP diphosphatase
LAVILTIALNCVKVEFMSSPNESKLSWASDKVLNPNVGVGIMVVDGEGLILLGRRKSGHWSMPGGKLDFGEGIMDCARRELAEETRLVAKSLELVSISNDIMGESHFVTIGFICKEFGGNLRTTEPDKIADWTWYPMEKLPESLFLPTARLLENYRSGKIIDDGK